MVCTAEEHWIAIVAITKSMTQHVIENRLTKYLLAQKVVFTSVRSLVIKLKYFQSMRNLRHWLRLAICQTSNRLTVNIIELQCRLVSVPFSVVIYISCCEYTIDVLVDRALLLTLERSIVDPVQIADCFVRHSEGFVVYSEYCTNYPRLEDFTCSYKTMKTSTTPTTTTATTTTTIIIIIIILLLLLIIII